MILAGQISSPDRFSCNESRNLLGDDKVSRAVQTREQTRDIKGPRRDRVDP